MEAWVSKVALMVSGLSETGLETGMEAPGVWEWGLEGGAVKLSLRLQTGGPEWVATLSASSPPTHRLDFYWLVDAALFAHPPHLHPADPDHFRPPLLSLSRLSLQDRELHLLHFPKPNLAIPGGDHIQLTLRLHVLQKEQALLPVFFHRFSNDCQVEVHGRRYFLSPVILRLALEPDSPLLLSLHRSYCPDWTGWFSASNAHPDGGFLEFLYQLYPTGRRIKLSTLQVLGGLAVRLRAPFLRRRLCRFVRKGGPVSLSTLSRIRLASAAHLSGSIAIIISRLSHPKLNDLKRQLSARLRDLLTPAAFSTLLITLCDHPALLQPNQRLARKAMPLRSFTTPPDEGEAVVLRCGEDGQTRLWASREVLVAAGARLGAELEVETGASVAAVAAALRLLYPEQRGAEGETAVEAAGVLSALGLRRWMWWLGWKLGERVARGKEGEAVSLGRAVGLEGLVASMAGRVWRDGVGEVEAGEGEGAAEDLVVRRQPQLILDSAHTLHDVYTDRIFA